MQAETLTRNGRKKYIYKNDKKICAQIAESFYVNEVKMTINLDGEKLPES
jgi:hypothetical protein